MLFDQDCPRAVRLSVNAASDRLEELDVDYGAAPDQALVEARDALVALLSETDAVAPGRALHAYLDRVQLHLIAFANALADRYFKSE